MRRQYYDFLGNRNKNTKLRLCQKLTGGRLKPLDKKRLSTAEIIFKISGKILRNVPAVAVVNSKAVITKCIAMHRQLDP
ncbi:mRNA-degrading endonuclease HigB of HigAB toxin-antitoxin module [Sporomusaceae bacterium BoRhaA]|uniref:hypothetical protein n=1 Tax=Pelorhabdus rhamnosifermentans TaxID=2772457 RepID=UPI001C063812|nr:hypothetical protein [Pelorhabdus rhamnosifermentans]MBU2700518.1 mRNA-degrading endonuclease HigB of HigAB toxin-antitoxin module [Pelorhabdus rhamnosifermentans]